MNFPTALRFLVYAGGLGASLLALSGYATYTDGVLDVLPFHVGGAITAAVTAVSSGLAMTAVWRGWGK